MIDLQEYPDAPINGESDFESSWHDKGMKTSALPNNIKRDINSGIRPASDGNMVKEAKHAQNPSYQNKPKRKKKTHKRPHLEEEANIEVDKMDEVEHGKDINASINDQIDEDMPPPDPKVKPFLPIPQKGDDGPVQRGDSDIDDIRVAPVMLNSIFLPNNLVKYKNCFHDDLE